MKITAAEKAEAIKKANINAIVGYKAKKHCVNKMYIRDLVNKTTSTAHGFPAINLRPGFQRGEVWDAGRIDGLINTMLEGGYIPPVVFGAVEEEENTGRVCCVDGGNRISAILRFITNKHTVGGIFIRGEDGEVVLDPYKIINRYVGKKFNQLPSSVQEEIKDNEIYYTLLNVKSNKHLTGVFIYLNCGGVNMDKPQIIYTKYNETEIGKSIVNIVNSSIGKSLCGIKKFHPLSMPKFFYKCAGYLATSEDFMAFPGDSGMDDFLFLHSKDKAESVIQRVELFNKSVQQLNKFFSGFKFVDRFYKKTGEIDIQERKIENENKVKAVILAVLSEINDSQYVSRNINSIRDRLEKRLNATKISKSNLYELLTVATTSPVRRKEAINQIRDCFGVPRK